MPATTPERSAEQTPTLHLARWTVTSGSNVNSRGAVVIASGDHQWEASAEGNGAVDALFRAVDKALAGVLSGHPRLIAYDVHAVAEGPDAEGRVTVTIAPPSAAAGARATGSYTGETTSTNIIAASIDAYIGAINLLLDEEHWAGATESAGNRKRARVEAKDAKARRAELDPDEANHDTTAWFER
ncbi:MAG TPA: alpha-isopropylmalate synthase regulatory domain-containing protein [Candidatus Limnocylindrales bacterium]|jgi:2-isopropylmalate synthase|nr:alpha-isopropylmalate synthase regulatory domain-containing protein [Candidatus Limnocylindrales bacterium]